MSKQLFQAGLKTWIILGLDVVFVLTAHILACLLRFEGVIDNSHGEQLLLILPLLVVIKIPVFYLFSMYTGLWRYTGLGDIIKIMEATVASSMLLLASLVLITHFQGLSRSVFILDGLLTFCLLAGYRVLIRLVYQYVKRHTPTGGMADFLDRKKRLLLIGAGDAADRLIREIRTNSALPYVVNGLVDDDPKKQGCKLHGVPVLGTTEDLQDIVVNTGVDELIITIATATGPQMRTIVSRCQQTGIKFRTMPSLTELINGKVSIKSLRDVAYKDLLGRPAVRLEHEEIGHYLRGKTVLVTGAGGSIGSELCRQILRFDPARLVLLDASEENLYTIQMELHHEFNFTNYIAILGKIQNRQLLDRTFGTYKPAVVFHAAAYKHVPLMENNPWEAVFNNVFGTRNVIETSVFHGVDRFVLVSTDKAVRPTNVMGATKRLTELLMLSYSGKRIVGKLYANLNQRWRRSGDVITSKKAATVGTKFIAVRFGNVLGSSGSVIPLFRKQIENGGPVTVTDPEMTRYFMSIEEATQLILQAGAMASGGEIFILKMGNPVRIATMARELIRLSGKEPDTEIEIKYTGMRPGEKLYEELITEGEGILPTSHEKIMVLKGNGVTYEQLETSLSRLAAVAMAHDGDGIKAVLQEIIPEYTPDLQARTVTEAEQRQQQEAAAGSGDLPVPQMVPDRATDFVGPTVATAN